MTRKGLHTPGARPVAELESEFLRLQKALNETLVERDLLKKQRRIFPGSH